MATMFRHSKLKKKEVAELLKKKQPVVIEKLITDTGSNVVLLSDYQKEVSRLKTQMKIGALVVAILMFLSATAVIWVIKV